MPDASAPVQSPRGRGAATAAWRDCARDARHRPELGVSPRSRATSALRVAMSADVASGPTTSPPCGRSGSRFHLDRPDNRCAQRCSRRRNARELTTRVPRRPGARRVRAARPPPPEIAKRCRRSVQCGARGRLRPRSISAASSATAGSARADAPEVVRVAHHPRAARLDDQRQRRSASTGLTSASSPASADHGVFWLHPSVRALSDSGYVSGPCAPSRRGRRERAPRRATVRNQAPMRRAGSRRSGRAVEVGTWPSGVTDSRPREELRQPGRRLLRRHAA